ncbi:MAG: DUF6504 family protein [Chloroflexota bacterium]|nr:DUF6504 family protein [Chloroflexota bacterium]
MSATLDVRRCSQARRGEKKRRRRSAEPIEMRERRHGYFPKAFTWRGRRYYVYAVERCWTVSRRGRGGRVERHCFRVRCSSGSAQDRCEDTFEVYQDVRHNTWHICSR